MAVSATELSIQRLNTETFISADPILVALSRPRPAIADGAGGFVPATGLAETLLPQIFRLIPSVPTSRAVETPDGALASPAFTLLAYWDADLASGDSFVFKNVLYQLIGPISPAHTDSPYERKVEVIRYGRR